MKLDIIPAQAQPQLRLRRRLAIAGLARGFVKESPQGLLKEEAPREGVGLDLSYSVIRDIQRMAGNSS